jgi:hypothetical protein
MRITDHEEQIQLDVVPLGGYQVILGMLWIYRYNPRIDWIARKVTLDQCDYGRRLDTQGPARLTPREELKATSTREVGYHIAQDPSLKQIPV